MWEIYDQEEIMRIHIQSERRDSGIMNVVIALKELGVSFSETVNRIAKQFSLSHEVAERAVRENWEE